MEDHQAKMEDYVAKRDLLKQNLQKMEAFKQKNTPKELASVIAKKCNDFQKEADKVKKQFNKGEVGTDQFIKEYLAKRREYYEHETVRQHLIQQQ